MDIDNLAKYFVEASRVQELINEQDESLSPVKKEKPIQKSLSEEIERTIKEYTSTVSHYSQVENLIPNRIKTMRTLAGEISQFIWKLYEIERKRIECELSKKSNDSNRIDEKLRPVYIEIIDELIRQISQEWNAPDSGSTVTVQSIEIEPDTSVVSPQGIEYNIESIQGDKVILKEQSTGKITRADITSIQKWKTL